MATRKKAEEEPKFEDALARLERIVEEMEAAELPLDEVLQKYEEGTRLVAFCTEKLTEAEKKIDILSKRKTAGAPDEPAPPPPAATDPEKDNDNSLF